MTGIMSCLDLMVRHIVERLPWYIRDQINDFLVQTYYKYDEFSKLSPEDVMVFRKKIEKQINDFFTNIIKFIDELEVPPNEEIKLKRVKAKLQQLRSRFVKLDDTDLSELSFASSEDECIKLMKFYLKQ